MKYEYFFPFNSDYPHITNIKTFSETHPFLYEADGLNFEPAARMPVCNEPNDWMDYRDGEMIAITTACVLAAIEASMNKTMYIGDNYESGY